MKQLIWLGNGRARWQDTTAPTELNESEALVRPIAVACCDLDVWTVRGQAPLQGPFPVGHEGVADVLSVGSNVTTVKPGDRVIVPFQVSCGQCNTCLRGHTEACTSVPLMTMYGMAPLAGRDAGGFLTDAVRVPYADAMLVPLPDDVDPAAAASLSDNVLDGWRCVGPYAAELNKFDFPDRRVLIIGHGSIGLYAAMTASALGATVDYYDTDPTRLTAAERIGVNATDSPIPARGCTPYPVTVSTRPDADALHTTLRATWPGGVCTDAAVHFGAPVPMPLLSMYTRGIRYVTGRVSARATIPAVLDLLTSGHVDTSLATDQVVPWDDADTAWPEMTGKTVFLRS